MLDSIEYGNESKQHRKYISQTFQPERVRVNVKMLKFESKNMVRNTPKEATSYFFSLFFQLIKYSDQMRKFNLTQWEKKCT